MKKTLLILTVLLALTSSTSYADKKLPSREVFLPMVCASDDGRIPAEDVGVGAFVDAVAFEDGSALVVVIDDNGGPWYFRFIYLASRASTPTMAMTAFLPENRPPDAARLRVCGGRAQLFASWGEINKRYIWDAGFPTACQ